MEEIGWYIKNILVELDSENGRIRRKAKNPDSVYQRHQPYVHPYRLTSLLWPTQLIKDAVNSNLYLLPVNTLLYFYVYLLLLLLLFIKHSNLGKVVWLITTGV